MGGRADITSTCGSSYVTLTAGSTITKTFINRKIYTDIEITKTDADDSTKIEGIGFTIKNNSNNKWVKSDGTYSSSAETIYTDANGKIYITGIDISDYPSATFTVTEVASKNPWYKADGSIKDTKPAEAYVKLTDSVYKATSGKVSFSFTNTKAYSVTINKQDEDGNTVDATFKIKCTYTNVSGSSVTRWLSVSSDGTISYSSSQPTTGISTTDGTLTLDGVPRGIYYIYETDLNTDHFYISEQPGYSSSNKWVYCGYVRVGLSDESYGLRAGYGTATVNSDNTNVTITYINIPNVSISGYVWIDSSTKDDEWTNLYESGETRVEGVTVYLKEKDGTVVATTTTDSNGEYKFYDKVLRTELDNYYVEFDYNTALGSDYITVTYNSSKQTGSKAMANSVATSDDDLTGIATTYAGTDSDHETTYGLVKGGTLYSNFYNSSDYTIEYINLGLKPIYDPDYSLTQSLEYVKIVWNGYTYTYEYGSEAELTGTNIPSVSYQNNNGNYKVYSRYFYPSAIYALLDNDESNDIEVYVVYSITITNTETYSNTERYVERSLRVDSLQETFDSKRYTLNSTYLDTTNTSFEGIESDFEAWTEDGNVATYAEKEIVLSSGESETVYIQFKVKDDAIKDILANPDGIAESYPTTATSNGYHMFTRYDYSWSNDISATQTHTSKRKTKTSSGAYIVFMLPDEDRGDRTVSGYVFEDSVITTDGQILGNGQYDDDENAVENVQVQLLEADTGEIATLYQPESDSNITNYKEVEATTATDENGYYELEGVQPGEYILSLTYYGEEDTETTYIVKSDGSKLEVDINEYKSTIVTSEVAANAIKDEAGNGTNEYEGEWYKYLEDDNYSVAVDDLDRRSDYNSGDSSITSMIAETATIDITIENTKDVITPDGNTLYENEFAVFNFGIIVQPEQSVNVEKLITNVKLYNTPNVIFDGNPETDDLTGVSDLDGSTNEGSTYTRVEIEEDSIYGSQLTITYTVKITNTSDTNYYETDSDYKGWYYLFGETGSYSEPVLISIDEVFDWCDPVLTYSSENEQIVEITLKSSDSEVWTYKDEEGNEYEVSADIIGDEYSGIIALANEGESDKYASDDFDSAIMIKDMGSLEIGDTADISFNFEKVLSTSDDDMSFTNVVNVSKMTNTVSEDDEDNETAEETVKLVKAPTTPEPAKAYITISAPTGEDRQSVVLYAIAGIVSLAILTVGIVIIKKKVL